MTRHIHGNSSENFVFKDREAIGINCLQVYVATRKLTFRVGVHYQDVCILTESNLNVV